MRCSTCLSAAVAIIFFVGRSLEANAYCRASTCREVTHCDMEESPDPACKPLAWKRPCVGITLEKSASNQVPFDIADAVLTKAFRAWEEPACDDIDGLTPHIHVENLGAVDCNLVEYNSKGGNANIVAFRDGTWPHPSGPHNIALTTVTFDTRTGEIYDADIEVNTAGFAISTTDTDIKTDLLSVVTHEAGHFLGLTHSLDANATMWASYTSGLIGPRTLALDDIGGICSAYPPSEDPIDPTTCNPIPRHGFSPACLSKQMEGDCSVSGAMGSIGSSHAAPSAFVLFAAAVFARASRSKSRRERRRS